MSVEEKKQCQIRLYPEQIDKIKAKVVQDKITFQKLAEILFGAYLKGNKEINRLVQKYADDKYSRQRRYSLTESESEELLRKLEMNHSPVKQFSEIYDEALEDEEF